VTTIAAIVFALVTTVAIVFQVALALGAPWGAYAMGGGRQGRLSPDRRVAAGVQAVLLAAMVWIVLGSAGIAAGPIGPDDPLWIWVVVGISVVAVVLNAITRSTAERRIWLPVAVAMLATSLVVAFGA
jgi:hypothetical protein